MNPFGGENPSPRNRVIDTFANAVFDYTLTASRTLINDFRYGYTRAHANQIPYGAGFDPTRLGLPRHLRDNASVLKFPTFSIGGNVAFSAIGSCSTASSSALPTATSTLRSSAASRHKRISRARSSSRRA